MTMTRPNKSLQRLEPFGKRRKEFRAVRKVRGQRTEVAGTTESTATPLPLAGKRFWFYYILTLLNACSQGGR